MTLMYLQPENAQQHWLDLNGHLGTGGRLDPGLPTASSCTSRRGRRTWPGPTGAKPSSARDRSPERGRRPHAGIRQRKLLQQGLRDHAGQGRGRRRPPRLDRGTLRGKQAGGSVRPHHHLINGSGVVDSMVGPASNRTDNSQCTCSTNRPVWSSRSTSSCPSSSGQALRD